MTWRWVEPQALQLLHGESLAEHGGRAGLRGAGLLASALTRLKNLVAYGTADVAALAAGEWSQEKFAQWLRAHMVARP